MLRDSILDHGCGSLYRLLIYRPSKTYNLISVHLWLIGAGRTYLFAVVACKSGNDPSKRASGRVIRVLHEINVHCFIRHETSDRGPLQTFLSFFT